MQISEIGELDGPQEAKTLHRRSSGGDGGAKKIGRDKAIHKVQYLTIQDLR
jgi:hypothetical protein